MGEESEAGEAAFRAADRLGMFGGAKDHFRAPVPHKIPEDTWQHENGRVWDAASPYDFEPTDPPGSAMLGLRHSAKIRRSMRVNGYKGYPITVVEHDGKKFVINGNHRLQAADGVLDRIPYQVVELPFCGYKNIEKVLDGWEMCKRVQPEWMLRRSLRP